MGVNFYFFNFLFNLILQISMSEVSKLRGSLRSSYESIQTTPIKRKSRDGLINSVPLYADTPKFPTVSRFLRVLNYKEQLYLNHVLIVATSTVWEFDIEEIDGSEIKCIDVGVSGNLESSISSMSTNSVQVQIITCNSYEECKQYQQQIQTPEGIIPSWTAYRIPLQSKIRYVVVLKKPPQQAPSDLTPVRFYFRGTYVDPDIAWEQESTETIILSEDTNKWKEIAFTILTLSKMGYNPQTLNKPVREIFFLFMRNVINLLIRYIF